MKSDRQRPALVALWVFLLGLGATFAIAAQWQRSNEAVLNERFEALALRIADRLDDRLNTYEYGLRGARGVVAAQRTGQRPDREQFRAYSATRDIDREFPGARGTGLIWRVPQATEAAFAESARRDGWADFGIRQLSPHDGERFVIQYIEPVERNRQAVGLDIASETHRRTAAITAMRSGQATLTAPITLVQASGKPSRSFLLLLPIYGPGAAPTNDSEREARAIGWAYAPLVIDEVLNSLLARDGQAELELRDVTATPAQTFFSSAEATAPAEAGLTRVVPLSIFGRRWEADFRATPAFVAAQHLVDPRAVAGIGALMALALSMLAHAVAQNRARQAQVRDEQARHAAMLACSSDAIIGQDTEGRVTDWNRAAERLFGYPAEAVIGRAVEEFLLPPECRDEDRCLRESAATGVDPAPIDTTRLAAGGRRVDVSISISAVRDRDGHCTGFTKSLRDISEARRAERLARETNAVLEERVHERTAQLETARRDLQTVLDAVPSMIGYWDRELSNRVANRAYSNWLAVDAEALRGRSIVEALGPELSGRIRPHAEAALRGEQQTFELATEQPDGTGMRNSLAHYLPDVVDGEVRGFYVVMHDVTEITQSRQALAAAVRDRQALLSTLDEHSIVSVADRQGRIIEVNDSFCRISGYTRDELVGRTHGIVNSGHHPRDFWVAMWKTIASGRSWQAEVCNRAKDGSLYWVHSIVAPFMDDNGQVVKYVSIRHDITARKQAQMALAHERDLMNALLEAVPDQIYFKDLESRFLRINPGLARRYGLADPGDAVGRSDADFFTADHAARTAAVERGIVETGEPVLNLEEMESWPDRPPTWNLTTKMPLRDAAGRIIGTCGISRDITHRKGVEAELAETNERFALAADAAGIGVWVFDPASLTFTWDAWMLGHHGMAPGNPSVGYESWCTLVHASDRLRVEAEVLDSLEHDSPYETEYRVVWPDGSERHLRSAAKVQRDTAGRALRMVGIAFDITGRKQAERELIDTSTLLRNVLDAATETSVIAVDPDGLISLFNRGAERLLGYRADEVIGRRSSMEFHDLDELRTRARELSEQTGRRIRTGMALVDPAAIGEPHEWSYLRKDGSRASVLLTVTELRSGDRALGYLGVAQDVSRQKKLETSLRKALNEARRADAAKSQFLANMSHEIRTPLNAVLGLAQLLEGTDLDDEQSDLVRKVRLGGRALLGVINDVLDLSKIDAGELHIEQTDFGVLGVLTDLHALMGVQAGDKQLRLELKVPNDLPASLRGDPLRLHQILSNLVANAIKFTDRGRVELRAEVVHAGEREVRLRFTVSDEGIGIAPEAQARLFQPFSQADASTTRRFGGTGLGLSIVKRLVTMMRGEVGLHSEVGIGSRFFVEIPFPLGAAAPAGGAVVASAGGAGLGGLRVLVVDDGDINLQVARKLLEREAACVSLAEDGRQALDHLRRHPEGIDVVLMDVHMPGMDGIEATRRIRGELGLTRLPIIALTAGALASERQAALDSGMDDFISKPFELADLTAKLLRHARPAAPGGPDAAARGMKVSPTWPRVAGIDAEDACLRMGGDAALFGRLLRGFLDEFAEARLLELLDRRDTRVALLHKLRGIAGNLGAKGLALAAGRAEEACRAEEEARAAAAIRETAALLQRLRAEAAPILQREDAVAPGPAAAAPPDAERLRQLRASLVQRDMAALGQFDSLSASLRCHLGPQVFEQVRSHLYGLRFDDALRLLEEPAADAVTGA
ncbi:MAG: PAS domain S-box protein [Piscinibacter sp.]|nr:PAS domain S-box protein [Piscinibacter sp.]